MRAAIEAIPDGVHGAGRASPIKRPIGGASQPSGKGGDGFIHIEAHGRGENYFSPTAESSKFRQVRGVTPKLPRPYTGRQRRALPRANGRAF